jgi:hypothetical protein
VVHQAVVVGDAPLHQYLDRGRRDLPPRRDVAHRPAPPVLLNQADALVEDRLLLLAGQGERVLVAVPVQADLVAGGGDHVGLAREAFDRVAGYEPRLLQAEAVEEPEQARHPHLGGENAAADVAGAVLPLVAAEPARHRVAVDAEGAEDFLGHPFPPSSATRAPHGGGAHRPAIAAAQRPLQPRLAIHVPPRSQVERPRAPRSRAPPPCPPGLRRPGAAGGLRLARGLHRLSRPIRVE